MAAVTDDELRVGGLNPQDLQKWILVDDPPIPDSLVKTGKASYTPLPTATNLFAKLPQVRDVLQAFIGDCVFLAVVAAILRVKNGPEYLVRTMRVAKDSKGELRCVVRLYPINEPPVLIAVRMTVPITDQVGGNDYFSQSEMWVRLLEKAFAAFGGGLGIERGRATGYESVAPANEEKSFYSILGPPGGLKDANLGPHLKPYQRVSDPFAPKVPVADGPEAFVYRLLTGDASAPSASIAPGVWARIDGAMTELVRDRIAIALLNRMRPQVEWVRSLLRIPSPPATDLDRALEGVLWTAPPADNWKPKNPEQSQPELNDWRWPPGPNGTVLDVPVLSALRLPAGAKPSSSIPAQRRFFDALKGLEAEWQTRWLDSDRLQFDVFLASHGNRLRAEVFSAIAFPKLRSDKNPIVTAVSKLLSGKRFAATTLTDQESELQSVLLAAVRGARPVVMSTANSDIGRPDPGRGQSADEALARGLVATHAYSLVDARESIISLRNPWGHYVRLVNGQGASARTDEDRKPAELRRDVSELDIRDVVRRFAVGWMWAPVPATDIVVDDPALPILEP